MKKYLFFILIFLNSCERKQEEASCAKSPDFEKLTAR